MRWLWFAAGWLMVALGFIGAMLPVMPTTIFLIMAVGCFARSSPRFERWLLEHPQFGRPLRQWREEGAISLCRHGGRLCHLLDRGAAVLAAGAGRGSFLCAGCGLRGHAAAAATGAEARRRGLTDRVVGDFLISLHIS